MFMTISITAIHVPNFSGALPTAVTPSDTQRALRRKLHIFTKSIITYHIITAGTYINFRRVIPIHKFAFPLYCLYACSPVA
jgi:hypothetical protein